LVPDLGHALAGPHKLAPFADNLFMREAMDPARDTSRRGEEAEPYSLQWYLNAEYQRYRRHGRWIPRLLEFTKHSGETMLGLGDGLGTDWVQYALHGARVLACSPSQDQLQLIRRNFELRRLPSRFIHAAPAALPLESASIDVVCLSGLSPEISDVEPVVEEIYRVLKPGGKVLAVMPAYYDIDLWASRTMPWHRRHDKKAAEWQTDNRRYTRRGLKRLFSRFVESRLQKRQLRRSEVPHLWRWIPLSLMERFMGHVLVYRGFKPLSAAIALQEAA
jgi:SAM-dependent methyltransferase